MQPSAPYPGGYPQSPYSPPPQQKRGSGGFGLILSLVITIILLLSALGFGIWAYMGMLDYKNNVQPKIDKAVEVAKQQTAAELEIQFVQREKEPHKEYKGPAAFGSISISYPKTWSAYINESGNGSAPVTGYFHPYFVPATNNDTTYALRVEVVEQSYANELKKFDAPAKSAKVKVNPYRPAANQDVLGARVDGEIANGKQGTMVLLPIRDKTLKIWTESEQYVEDLEKTVLPKLNFAK